MVQGSTTQQYKELSYNEMSVSVFIVPDNTQSLSGWLLSPWIHIAGHLEDKSATLTVRLCLCSFDFLYNHSSDVLQTSDGQFKQKYNSIFTVDQFDKSSIIAPKWLCLAKAVE